MARISLKCECGWNFFVPGSTQGNEAPCPNCGAAVIIPGRKAIEGGPKAPGVVAAEKQAKQKQLVLLISVAAGILLLSVVLLMATSGSPKPVEDAEGPKTNNALSGPRPPSTGPRKTPASSYKEPEADVTKSSTPVGPNREAKIEEHRQAIRVLVWRLNLAGIAGESLRLRGHADAVAALLERMKVWDAKIAEHLAQLLELGDRFAAEPHVQPGDRLIAFAQKDFGALPGGKVDLEVLSPYLRAFRAGQPLEQMVLLRGTQKIELYLQFPAATEDLQELARLPDVSGPGRYEDGFAAPTSVGAAPLPPAVLKEVETRFQAIPAGYRLLLPPAEAQRLDQVLKAKSGSAEDLGFLQGRILSEALPGFEREHALVRSREAELKVKLGETTAVDVIHFKDGRKISGQVLVNDDAQVKIKSRLGTMTVPKADVLKVESGKGPGLEFPAKLAATPRTAPELSKLLVWCEENKLKLEAEYTANLLVAIDPLHEAARRTAGLPPKPVQKSSGGPAPSAPSSAPLGAPPAAGGDAALKAMDLLAADVVSKNLPLADILERMRSGSIGFTVSSAPTPAPRAVRAAMIIQDPLTFSLARLDAPTALEMGQWWGALSIDDRREFARFFGLWCSQRRLGK